MTRQKGLIVGGVLCAGLLGVASFRDESGISALLALSALQLAPVALCWHRRKIDYLAIILGGQFVGYSFTTLVRLFWHGFQITLSPEAIQGLRTLSLCTVLSLVGFYGVRRIWNRTGADSVNYNPVFLVVKEVATIGGLLLFFFWLTGRDSGEQAVFLRNTQFVLCVLVFCVEAPRIRWGIRLLQSVVVLGVLYSYLLDTNLGFAINLLVIWSMQAVLARDPIVLLRAVALLVVMLPLQWVKGDYRYVVGQHPTYSVFQRGLAFFELLQEKMTSKERTALTLPAPERSLATNSPERVLDSSRAAREAYLGAQALKSALDRARDDTLDRVLAWTPSTVGFWKGESYRNAWYLMIPRQVWPDKPRWNVWNQFGKRYGVISPADDITEVVFSSFVEAYMNFGYVWLYSFALLWGIAIAFLQRLSVPSSFTFICFLMPFLSYQEDIGSSLVKLIFTALVILPFHFLRRRIAKLPTVNA